MDELRPKILIVEDVSAMMLPVVKKLEKLGWEAIGVTSAKSALEAIAEHDFELLLVDVIMPEVNGFELAEKIKADKRYSETPIIFITGLEKTQEMQEKGYHAGGMDFIFKPLNYKILENKVKVFYQLFQNRLELEKTNRILKEKNKKLVDLSDKIKETYDIKNRMLANIVHDIKTPLSSIIGLSDLLSQANVEPEYQDYIKIQKKAADSLLMMLHDILDMSKLKEGKLSLEKIFFDLKETLLNNLAIVEMNAKNRNIQLKFEYQDNLPTRFIGDPNRLGQVIQNLLSNAVKFTTKGTIYLRVKGPDGPTPGETPLIIEVEDTGKGMDPQRLSSIFNRYEQEDVSINRQFGGTGLGLAICKSIIDLMKGSIKVTSQIDIGSKFSISLSLPQVSSETMKREDLKRQVKVLTIDDNKELGQLLQSALEEYNFSVTTVQTGKEGMEIFLASPPDLVLLDYFLPDTNGLEMIQKIRAVNKTVPVFLLSGHAKKSVIDEVAKHGINHYFKKPIEDYDYFLSAMVEAGENYVAHSVGPHATEKDISDMAIQVLMAEDSPELQLLTSVYLKNTDIKLVAADNGALATEKYKTYDFDIVILDMEMPVMDGLETLRTIREWERNNNRAETPVMMLTGNPNPSLIKECTQSGAQDFLIKPVKKNILIKKIFEVVRADLMKKNGKVAA